MPAEGARSEWNSAPRAAPARDEGRAPPYLSAREDHFRFPGAQPHEPWPDIRGRHEDDLGSRQLSAARYPGHAAGPVLQHRPSGTPPKLWTELEGLAM